MTDPERLVLERPRNLGGLLSDSASLYRRHFWTFIAIACVVVLPVHAIVLGLGLGQFSGGYDSTPKPQSAFVPILVQVLVVGPLVAVMTLHALRELAEGRRPRAGAAIQAGLDAFAPVFLPVLVAVLLEVVTIPTVILPVVLLVRFYFVPQVVVVEGKRGTDALRASWERTRGFAWRAAGLILVVQLLWQLGGGLVSTPLAAVAKSADSEALTLASTTLAETLIVAPLGIFAALLYFDLGARQSALAQR